MFGIGPQEVVIIVLLVVVVFGPAKAASMLRDLGRFTNEARRPLEELKSELLDSEEVKEVRHAVGEVKSEVATSVEEFKDEAQRSVDPLEEFKKTEVAVSPEGDEPADDPVGSPLSDDEAKEVPREPREPKEVRKPPLAEQTPPAEQQKEEEKTARTQKESEQPDADSEGFSLGGLTLGSRRGGHKRSRNRPRWGRLFGG